MPNKTAEIEAILGQSTSKRKWLWPVIIGTGLVLAAGGLWLWWPGTGAQRAPQYVTQAIDRGDVTVTVTATGSVEPTNVVEISTELSGTVRAVNFDFNDIVKAGDHFKFTCGQFCSLSPKILKMMSHTTPDAVFDHMMGKLIAQNRSLYPTSNPFVPDAFQPR